MSAVITITEALDLIKRKDANGQKAPFAIRFVTRDAGRSNKPSKHMHIPKAEECGAKHSLVRHRQIGVRPVDGGHPYAVHIKLITHINGQLVV